MSPVGLSLVVFACVFGGALVGMVLRPLLPEDHLSPDSKDMVKIGMGLIGTISALVLGLLVASAKASYDAQKAELTGLTARVAVLDRVLAHYGPEAKPAREVLRTSVLRGLDEIWQGGSLIGAANAKAEGIYDLIQDLAPSNEMQRSLQAQASTLIMEVGRTRWLMYAQRNSSVSMPLLVTVVFWLTVNFISLGLLAPRNGTVVVTLFVCALSVSGAIFLILEMDRPFDGMIQISKEPLREVADILGR
jgi:hypothetical protein